VYRQAELASSGLRRAYVAKELADGASDFDRMCFESKVASVEESNFGVRQVAPVSLCAGWNKERIVLAPNGKERRLLCGEVFVEFGIERDIVCIIEEKIELDLVVPWSRE
jgi:hypothetical protein